MRLDNSPELVASLAGQGVFIWENAFLRNNAKGNSPCGTRKFHKLRLVYIPVSCLLYEWELFFSQGQKFPEILGTFGKLKRSFQQFLEIAIAGSNFRLYLVNWIQGKVALPLHTHHSL